MSRFSMDWSELSLQVMIAFAHFLWQACVVGLIVFVAQHVAESRRNTGILQLYGVSIRRVSLGEADLRESELRGANIRYTIACVAFFSLPICVIATFAWVHQSRGPIVLVASAPVAPPSSPMASANEANPTMANTDIPVLSAQATRMDMDALATEPIEASTLVVEPKTFLVQRIQAFAPYLLLAYLVGVGFMLARFSLSFIGISRLRRTIQPITDVKLLRTIAEQCARIGLKRVPLVALCQRVSVPVVVGIVKPMILLPPTLLCGLDPNQVAAILSHELAHIRRYDLIVNLLQRVVEALLFFHPVTWWITRRVSIERENCCDDVAADCMGRLPYAGALLQMAELCIGNDRPRAAALATLSATGESSTDLGYRIRRLIGTEETTRVGVSRRGVAIGMTLLTLLMVSLVAWGQHGESPNAKLKDGSMSSIFTPEPLWQTKVAANEVASEMTRVSPVAVVSNRVLTIGKDFDLATGKEIQNPFVRLPQSYEFEVTLAPVFRRRSSDHKHIVEASNRASGKTSSMPSYDLKVLRAKNGSQVGVTITVAGHFGWFDRDVDVENGGNFLLLGSGDEVRVYRTETGLVETTMPVKTKRIDAVAISPDRDLLVVSDQNDLHFWQWRDQAPVKTIHVGRKIDGLVFTPDGQYLAEGPDTREDIQIRDMRTLEVVASLKDEVGSPLMVSSMDISPDGRYLVAHNEVSVDQKKLAIPHQIHVWDLQSRGKPVFQIATGERVRKVAFSDDGGMIVGEFSGAAHGALLAAWKLPDERINRKVDAPRDAKDRLGDGIRWSHFGDENGLRPGARLILPKDGLKPGQPLVVEYRLANVSMDTKTLKCYLNNGTQFMSLGHGNRIGGFLDRQREPVTLTIEPGDVFIDTEHLVSIDTTGLEPGKYQVALDSAFANTKHEIPHRGSIPFTIDGESTVKVTELPKSEIHWGKPIAGLQVGARFAGDPKAYAIGATIQADLFVANVTDQPIECSVVLPHPGDGGWPFHVEGKTGATIMFERQPPVDRFSHETYVHLQLAPGAVAPITGEGVQISFSSASTNDAFETTLSKVKFQTVGTKEEAEQPWQKADDNIQGRLVTQGGAYSAIFEATLVRPEIPAMRLELDTGNVPFTVLKPRENAPAVDQVMMRSADDKAGAMIAENLANGQNTGALKGRIALDGVAPKLPKLRVRTPASPWLSMRASDEERKKYEASLVEIDDESMQVDADQGLANAFVYLANVPSNWQPIQEDLKPFTLKMQDDRFAPRAAILRMGQDVRLNNSSVGADNFAFETMKNGGQNRAVGARAEITLEHPFTSPERIPIQAKSQMHPWKMTFLLPLDHPFAAITDSRGKFSIEGLPPGEHSFLIWHERTGWLEKSLVINIQAGKTTEVNRSYSVDRMRVVTPNVFGDPVAGISIRLQPLVPIKLNSAPPEIAFETKRDGNLDLILSEVPTSENRIAVDGEIYSHSGLPLTEAQPRYRSVKDRIAWKNTLSPRIVLDGQWKSVKDGQPLKLAPGKHVLRFGWGGFRPLGDNPQRPDKTKPAVIWSNLVELTVLDYAEVAIAYDSGLASYDLDTEKGIGPTASLVAEDQLAAFDLRAGHGAAGLILTGQLRNLIKVGNEFWSTVSMKAIRERLTKKNDSERIEPQLLGQQGEKLPSTWIVETNQGAVAILQIEFRDDIKTELGGIVKGFVVRYRLSPRGPEKRIDLSGARKDLIGRIKAALAQRDKASKDSSDYLRLNHWVQIKELHLAQFDLANGIAGIDLPAAPAATPEQIAELRKLLRFRWGLPVDGIQVGIARTDDRFRFTAGEKIPFQIFIRNITQEPITQSLRWFDAKNMTASLRRLAGFDSDKNIYLSPQPNRLLLQPTELRLEPGVTMELPLGQFEMDTVGLHSGVYNVDGHFPVVFPNQEGELATRVANPVDSSAMPHDLFFRFELVGLQPTPQNIPVDQMKEVAEYADIEWGKTVYGLQAGARYRNIDEPANKADVNSSETKDATTQRPLQIGATVKTEVLVRNVSDQPVTVRFHPSAGSEVQLLSAMRSNLTEVASRNIMRRTDVPIAHDIDRTVERTLQPGEVFLAAQQDFEIQLLLDGRERPLDLPNANRHWVKGSGDYTYAANLKLNITDSLTVSLHSGRLKMRIIADDSPLGSNPGQTSKPKALVSGGELPIAFGSHNSGVKKDSQMVGDVGHLYFKK